VDPVTTAFSYAFFLAGGIWFILLASRFLITSRVFLSFCITLSLFIMGSVIDVLNYLFTGYNETIRTLSIAFKMCGIVVFSLSLFLIYDNIRGEEHAS